MSHGLYYTVVILYLYILNMTDKPHAPYYQLARFGWIINTGNAGKLFPSLKSPRWTLHHFRHKIIQLRLIESIPICWLNEKNCMRLRFYWIWTLNWYGNPIQMSWNSQTAQRNFRQQTWNHEWRFICCHLKQGHKWRRNKTSGGPGWYGKSPKVSTSFKHSKWLKTWLCGEYKEKNHG